MSASVARMHGAWAALGAFLRGFVGIGGVCDVSTACSHSHPGRPQRDTGNAPITAASARAALIDRAARRPSCC